jgi:hypothetical protein
VRWGWRVIVEYYGASVTAAFYDQSTGELVGYTDEDDILYTECAGIVPNSEIQQGLYLSDTVALCPADGGTLSIDGGR